MASWITSGLQKVQARAERILEQVDQKAATKLQELGVATNASGTEARPRYATDYAGDTGVASRPTPPSSRTSKTANSEDPWGAILNTSESAQSQQLGRKLNERLDSLGSRAQPSSASAAVSVSSSASLTAAGPPDDGPELHRPHQSPPQSTKAESPPVSSATVFASLGASAQASSADTRPSSSASEAAALRKEAAGSETGASAPSSASSAQPRLAGRLGASKKAAVASAADSGDAAADAGAGGRTDELRAALEAARNAHLQAEEARAQIRELQLMLQEKDKVISVQAAEQRALQRQQEQEFQTALLSKEAQQRELRTRLEEVLRALKGHEATLEAMREERDALLRQQASAFEMQAAALRAARIEEEEREKLLDHAKQEHLKTQLEARTRESELESEHAAYVKALANMQKQLEEKQAEVARRESQVRWMETACEALRHEVADAEQQAERERGKAQQAAVEAQAGREALGRELEALRRQLGEREAALAEREATVKGLERRLASLRPGASSGADLESRLHAMAEHVLQKQSAIENLTAQNRALQLQLEDAARRAREAESGGTMYTGKGNGHVLRDDEELGGGGAPRRRLVAGRDKEDRFVRTEDRFAAIAANPRLRRPAEVLDLASQHVVNVLRGNPTARMALLVYAILLHVWVIYVVSSFQGRITRIHHLDSAGPPTGNPANRPPSFL
eukprot:tig00021123_g18491.t1